MYHRFYLAFAPADVGHRYRQLAVRFIDASGRSAAGKLRKKMTIMVVEPSTAKASRP